MTKDEALKKAFKQAFQLGQDYWYQADHEYVSQNKKSDVTRAKFEQLMEDAIKEALIQPEQEPVGDFYITKDMAEHIKKLEVDWTICASGSKRPTEKKVVPVFVGNTTPPQPWEKFCDSNCVWTDHHPDCKLAQRKPLTDEQIDELSRLMVKGDKSVNWLCRAIEAAHGIKGGI